MCLLTKELKTYITLDIKLNFEKLDEKIAWKNCTAFWPIHLAPIARNPPHHKWSLPDTLKPQHV